MESFNQLLNQYIQRAGISDSELARTLGVSRQTIFRWREGQTGRPRHREDVLLMAQKLRLAPAERDTLLLAAGFRPEALEPAALAPTEPQVEDRPEPDTPEATNPAQVSAALPSTLAPEEVAAVSERSSGLGRGRISSKFRWLLAAVVGLVLLSGGVWWGLGGERFRGESTPGFSQGVGGPRPTPATRGERLILVTHFANYASSQVGYNIAGRLTEALQQEIEHSDIPQVRVAVWPEVAGDLQAARQAGQAVSATLVIYGEYDVGRVVVKFAAPAGGSDLPLQSLQREALDLQALSAIINGDIPQQVRSVALLILGQIYLDGGDSHQALALLRQARDKLQALQVEPQTQAVANFYLGMAYQRQQLPALEETIGAYSAAIERWPEMISSYINRSAAYVERGQAGDLERALADAERVVAAKPDWGLAYYNRASIRLRLAGAENRRLALADLDQALALEPELPQAHLNRAFIYTQQGRPLAEVVAELEKALTLRPNYGEALNLLCWRYGLAQQPQRAMPYCQQAVQLQPQRAEFQDSRGLVYALQGDYPAAIADFEAYRSWLSQTEPSPEQEEILAQRQGWIQALKAGENPFTPEVLEALGEEQQ